MNSPLINKFFIFILLLIGALLALRFSLVLLSLLMPFVIGFFIALIANPLKKRFEKFGLPPALAALTSILIIMAVLFAILYMVFSLARSGIDTFEKYSDQIIESLTSNFKEIYHNIQSHYPKILTKDFQGFVADIMDGGLINLKDFNFGGKIFHVARSLPSTLIFIIFSLMSSYYFCVDLDRIMGFIKKKLQSSQWMDRLAGDFRESIRLGIGSWIKAQFVIMSISFVLATIFFLILKVPFPFLVALGLAFFDALPLFGAGAILWPMSAYYLLTQEYFSALIGLILYVLMVSTRQIVEPRLIGHQIGINPLITLFTVYLGFKLMGVAGIILGVITLVIATSILNGKAFSDFRKTEE